MITVGRLPRLRAACQRLQVVRVGRFPAALRRAERSARRDSLGAPAPQGRLQLRRVRCLQRGRRGFERCSIFFLTARRILIKTFIRQTVTPMHDNA